VTTVHPSPGTDRAALDTDHQTAIGLMGISVRSVQAPPTRLGLLPRKAQVKELLDASGDQVVVVAAPAGYGKTTTMTLWDAADERPFAWVHLGPVDDDPVHLLRHVAVAVHQIHPIDEADGRELTGAGRSVPLDMLPAVVRILEAASPLVVVLDDVHVPTSSTALSCLDHLLDHRPDGCQLALVGRSVPALPLARRRMSDGVVEVDTQDLALTDHEAAQLLEHAGITLDEPAVQELVRQTEGWPGGLHLAALALSRRDRPAQAGAFSGRDRLVADYLVEEVLEGLPPATVDFLQRSAILDAMNAALLDDLLETDTSARMLRDIDQTGNRFLVPLDDEREWFRYHHLFAEMLRARLWATDPRRARRLHARASNLLERSGDSDGAVRHAVAADDDEHAADLILAHAVELVFGGRAAQLRQWLDLLGLDAIERLPAAAVAWAWYGLAAPDHPLIVRATTAATRSGWSGPLADGSPSIAVAVASVRSMTGSEGLPGVLRDAQIVRDGGGPDVNPYWGMATVIQASAVFQRGELALARELFVESLPSLARTPAFEAGALAQLALLELRDGNDTAADELAARAIHLTEVHNLEGVVPSVSAFAVGALVAARRGRTDDAVVTAAAARRMVVRLGLLSPRTVLFCDLLLAETALVLGDRGEARELLDEAERAAEREPTAVGLRDQLDRLRDELARSDLTPGAAAAVGLTSAELRVIPYLSTHLSLQEIAEQLFISRNTAKSHSVAIYRKLGVSSRSAAVAEAQRLGIIDAP